MVTHACLEALGRMRLGNLPFEVSLSYTAKLNQPELHRWSTEAVAQCELEREMEHRGHRSV